MTDLIERLDTWLRENRPDYYAKLNPGISDEELNTLEAKLGVALPEEFNSLHRWRDGQSSRNFKSFYYNYTLMDADDIAETVKVNNELLEAGDFKLPDWWDPRWIPFLSNGSGDNYCIDMAGSFGGVKGQVLEFNHDYESREIHHASFAKWLESVVRGFEEGMLEYDDEGMQPVDEEYDALLAELNPGYPVSAWAGGKRPEWLAEDD